MIKMNSNIIQLIFIVLISSTSNFVCSNRIRTPTTSSYRNHGDRLAATDYSSITQQQFNEASSQMNAWNSQGTTYQVISGDPNYDQWISENLKSIGQNGNEFVIDGKVLNPTNAQIGSGTLEPSYTYSNNYETSNIGNGDKQWRKSSNSGYGQTNLNLNAIPSKLIEAPSYVLNNPSYQFSSAASPSTSQQKGPIEYVISNPSSLGQSYITKQETNNRQAQSSSLQWSAAEKYQQNPVVSVPAQQWSSSNSIPQYWNPHPAELTSSTQPQIILSPDMSSINMPSKYYTGTANNVASSLSTSSSTSSTSTAASSKYSSLTHSPELSAALTASPSGIEYIPSELIQPYQNDETILRQLASQGGIKNQQQTPTKLEIGERQLSSPYFYGSVPQVTRSQSHKHRSSKTNKVKSIQATISCSSDADYGTKR